MAEFAVSVEKNRWLKARMEQLGVREADLEERFVHASGSGGQHVNKSSSCVYLKHLPTGAEVKCMEARSQSLNRFLARRYLLEKLEALAGGVTAKDAEAERLRKSRRPAASGAAAASTRAESSSRRRRLPDRKSRAGPTRNSRLRGIARHPVPTPTPGKLLERPCPRRDLDSFGLEIGKELATTNNEGIADVSGRCVGRRLLLTGCRGCLRIKKLTRLSGGGYICHYPSLRPYNYPLVSHTEPVLTPQGYVNSLKDHIHY